MTDALKQLDALAQLPADWDGEGSPPIVLDIIAAARGLLTSPEIASAPAPNVVPVSGGGLQLEWRRPGRYLELAFLNAKTLHVLLRLPSNVSLTGYIATYTEFDYQVDDVAGIADVIADFTKEDRGP